MARPFKPQMTVAEKVEELGVRADMIDDAVAEARAYRCFLEDLNSRCPLSPSRADVAALEVVRAALLRAAIGTATAILDRYDARGNRASLGHIVMVMRDAEVVGSLLEHVPEQRRNGRRVQLDELATGYRKLCESDPAQRLLSLRNNAVAHILRPDEATATVEYPDTFNVMDETERLVALLFDGCDRVAPKFPALKRPSMETAALFWDTYLAGVAARGRGKGQDDK